MNIFPQLCKIGIKQLKPNLFSRDLSVNINTDNNNSANVKCHMFNVDFFGDNIIDPQKTRFEETTSDKKLLIKLKCVPY